MKNVTKTNVLFTMTVLVYIILVYSIRLVPSGTFSMNFLLVLPEIILLIPSIMYMVFLRPDNVGDYGCETVSVSTGILSAVFAFCIIPLVSLINFISSFFVSNSVDQTLAVTSENNPLIINLIILAVIPAVAEEFIFRGLIFNGYKTRNPLKAALLSAVLFGLIHININQFCYAFVIGFIFALLVYATGSIIPSIIAHFVINGTSVVMTYVIQALDDAAAKSAETMDTLALDQSGLSEAAIYLIALAVIFIMAIAGTCLAGVAFYFICKKNRGMEGVKSIFKRPRRNTYDETQGKFLDGYLWLGIGICIVYIILYEFILV